MQELTRRTFIGGGTALFLSGRELWGETPPAAAGIWERPDGTATDAVMVRRLYLDLAGRIPTAGEARAYVGSKNPNKRVDLVTRLLGSAEFVDFWTMRFSDILRVKSEFPINLWPNAVYAYNRRIRQFVASNESWDHFGTALLTAQGSDFRDGEVNFFRATSNRTPEGWAEAVAQTFLGIPPDKLTPVRRRNLAAFFTSVRIKDTREWKEEIVYVEGRDRRRELCRRLFKLSGDEVVAAFRRRVSGWIFGRHHAVVGAPDELRLKALVRSIVLSPAYAAGSVTGGFPARRIEAEVLDDAFTTLAGGRRDYQSPAPEPFSFLPPERPTVCIEDGSISSGFLTLFGRPARDTGLPDERRDEVTAKQRLMLFNSAKLNRQLWAIVKMPKSPEGKWPSFDQRVHETYWRVLGRFPARRELAAARALLTRRQKAREKDAGGKTVVDVAWCLVNSREFLFRV